MLRKAKDLYGFSIDALMAISERLIIFFLRTQPGKFDIWS